MKNFVLFISYDGSSFLGWQKTKHGKSIEGTLQKHLEIILNTPIKLNASSRTDKGVHAEEQVVNFITSTYLSSEQIKYALNSRLPKTIVVKKIIEKQLSFHATLSSKRKIYRYNILCNSLRDPFLEKYVWHIFYKIDLDKLYLASQKFIGTKDFKAFCNTSNTSYPNTIRTISSIKITFNTKHHLAIFIEGSNFLYKMVRNIIGTIVYIGANKISLDSIDELFAKKQRNLTGITAPAHGLFLHKVIY